jgi:glutathione S-transferase
LGGNLIVMQLIIGNPNYSSWSMRGWLLLKLAGLPFEETVVQLGDDNWQDDVRAMGGQTGKVPILIDEGFAIWDTMAIAEYCHEHTGRIWPSDPSDRARARSLAAEMHSGFPAIRSSMPCNVRARDCVMLGDKQLEGEIARVAEIWSAARGPFLFGDFSGADIFFAPIASRFQTYAVRLPGCAGSYQEQLLKQAFVREWCKRSAKAPVVSKYELPSAARRSR